jgi:hypothetical protein
MFISHKQMCACTEADLKPMLRCFLLNGTWKLAHPAGTHTIAILIYKVTIITVALTITCSAAFASACSMKGALYARHALGVAQALCCLLYANSYRRCDVTRQNSFQACCSLHA